MSHADVLAQVPPPIRRPWFVWLAAGVVALVAFLVITWLMFTNPDVQNFDTEVALECQSHANNHPGTRAFFLVFTHVGGRAAMALLAALGFLVMIVRKHYLLAFVWFLATGGGGLLNVVVKESISRQRPDTSIRDPSLNVRHDSFPSGHAMGSIIGYGMWLYAGCIFIQRRGVRGGLIVAAILLVAAIGFSRVYLRAHWVSDILAGFSLGFAWLSFSVAAGHWLRRKGQMTMPGIASEA